MKKIHLVIITWFLLIFSPSKNWAQCAMCRAVLESSEGQRAAEGINNGITYLMIIPYILVVIVGYQIYKNKK